MSIHSFPPPPRPSASKANGHPMTNGDEKGDLSHDPPYTDIHLRDEDPSDSSEDMDCEGSEEEIEGIVFVHGELVSLGLLLAVN